MNIWYLIAIIAATLIVGIPTCIVFITESEPYMVWRHINDSEAYQRIDSAYGRILYYKEMGRLRFDQFLHLYAVNPDAWHIYDKDLEGYYATPWREDRKEHEVYGICWPTFREFMKYRHWVRKQLAMAIELKETQTAKADAAIQDENLQAVMKLVQGDINATQEGLYVALENLKASMEAFGMDIKEITEIKCQ